MSSPKIFAFIFLAANLLVSEVVQGCLFTIQQLRFLEEDTKDYSVVREYIICANQLLKVGKLDYSNKLISDSPAIPLRSNLHIKCGESGSRDNKCIIRGGDVQLDGTNYFGMDKSDTIENVVIEGFTFEGTSRYSVWATRRGDITFIDCEWKDITEAYVPLYFDYFDAAIRNSYLTVNFIDCDFLNNRFYGDGAYPAIIVANGEQNRLNLERNLFLGNDYVFNNTQSQRNSFLIESSGHLNMELNCFKENNVGVAPVASYGTQVISDRNFGTESNGRKCDYIARFDTQVEFDSFTPGCSNYETVQFCEKDFTNSPSASPSSHPTSSPSTSPPTDEPSQRPTLSSKPSVSTKPSDTVPSASPSIAPTVTPSSAPSETPSLAPSRSTSGTAVIALSFIVSVIVAISISIQM